MSDTHLATYLRDHRSGAVGAVELLTHLEETFPNTTVSRFAAELRAEVNADVEMLESVMARAGAPPSRTRQAAAWITEKLAELKMAVEDTGDGSLRLLETLEAVALGVEGKRGLWVALASVGDRTPALAGVDYARLIKRAEDQRQAIEPHRLAAAAAALNRG